MTDSLAIVVVEEDRERAVAIDDAMKASGSYEVHVIVNISSLARKIAKWPRSRKISC